MKTKANQQQRITRRRLLRKAAKLIGLGREPHHAILIMLLSQPKHMLSFLLAFGPEEIVSLIDGSLPVILSTTFYDEVLGKLVCDIRAVFTCKPHPDGPDRIEIIIEIKPESDAGAALQLETYILCSRREHAGDGVAAKRRQHPIYGFILHSGGRPWNEAVSTPDAIRGNRRLRQIARTDMNHLVDLAIRDPEEVIGKDRVLSAIFFAICFAMQRRGPIEECLKRSLGILGARSIWRTILATFIGYMYGVTDRDRLTAKVAVAWPDGGEENMNAMFQAVLKEGKAEGMATGLAKGKAEGRVEGRVEGKAETFLRQARSKYRRVPKNRAAQVRAASVPQLDIWLDRILTATSLNEVFGGEAGNAPAVNGAPANPPHRKRSAK